MNSAIFLKQIRKFSYMPFTMVFMMILLLDIKNMMNTEYKLHLGEVFSCMQIEI